MGVLWRSAVVMVLLFVVGLPAMAMMGPQGSVEFFLMPVLALIIGIVWYLAARWRRRS